MAELRVPTLDFSALGDLPQVYQKNANEASKRMTLADLAAGKIDRNTAAQRLMGVDQQVGMSLANLGNNERDFAFRQEEAKRAQENANRGFGLQEKQIAATAGNTAASQALARAQFEFAKEQGNRPEIREVTDDNGNKSLVLVDRKDPTKTAPINVPGQSKEQNNPFLTGGAMNESQSKDALYANRMLNAERTFRDPKVIDAGLSPVQRGLGAIPGVGNYAVSDNYQRYDQAQRDFINATLRRESGAVISPQEFDNAAKQYFPRPGDSPDVLKQKQQNRIEAIKGIGAGGGRGYKPNASFDQAGNIVERGQPQQAQPQAQQASIQDGATATNPQTGQKIMFRGGQWMPVQ